MVRNERNRTTQHAQRRMAAALRARLSLHHCNANDQQSFSSVPLLAHLFPLLLFFPSLRFTLFSLVVLSRTAAPTTISASPTTLNSTRVSTQLRSEDRRGLLSPRATLTRAGGRGRLDWRALWARARFSSVHRRSRPLFSRRHWARESNDVFPHSPIVISHALRGGSSLDS